MSTVGWLGLGAMGSRMARRLLDAGTDLVVWNRTPGRAEMLPGARVAATPAEAVRQAELVVTLGLPAPGGDLTDPGADAARPPGPAPATVGRFRVLSTALPTDLGQQGRGTDRGRG